MSDTNIHALPVGHSFDGYRILRVLGAGGFGITYLAEETAIGRKVAIKEYLPQGFGARAADSFTVRAVSASAREQFAWGLTRFRQEATTLVAFEHPNIVSVYRYFEANGTAYLVMQYVEGKPLDALISGGKTLAESEIEEVILPILDGLEQVHAAHFLHRDIKPANIYIRKDGRPVLLDFGAARQAFGTESKSITAIVSEGYAPFEQYEAKGDQKASSDIYAIGAVLYRCITGERPPAAPERVSARLYGSPDPLRPVREAARGSYSARLLEATERALATMQGGRPQTVAELRALLQAGDTSRVASRAPQPAVPSVPPPATAPQRKSRVPLLAGIGGIAVAAAAAGYFTLASDSRKPDTASAPPPAKTIAATPATPPPTAPSPNPDEPADRAAQEAEAELAAAKERIDRGELARVRDDLAVLVGRIEDALRKRPDHARLQRARASARALEAELGQRIAARVKELVDGAEREAAGNYAEALRLIGEAERLDPAAAKAARERIEAARRRAEDEKERKSRSELHVSLARYHLDQARDAAAQGSLAEARRIAEQARVQVARAFETLGMEPGAAAAPSALAELRRQVEEFHRDLGQRIARQVAWLIEQARAAIVTGKLDDAAKKIEEAAALAPAEAELAALRRELEEARKKPATPAPPADPDAAERERTRGIVRDPGYDARARRGAVYFAFGGATLTPPMLQALGRGAEAAQADAHAHLTLLCGYDQLEVASADEGRKLALARCEVAQREAARRLGAGRIRTGHAAPGKGPEFRRVAFSVQSEKPPEAAPPTEPQTRTGAFPLAGRTARLSRISAERRAVMRIELQFGAGGALNVTCSAESADGGQTACFGQRSGSGRWSLSGSTLCLSSAVLNLPGNACYELSGAGNQFRLGGGGFLAGTMVLQ